MIDIASYLTSDFAIYVYIFIIVACGIGVIYGITRNSDKRKQKQNTKELFDSLDDFVEPVKEEKEEVKKEEIHSNIEPVTVELDNNSDVDVIEELAKDNSFDEEVVEVSSNPTIIEVNNEEEKIEKKEDNNLVYAPIELNKEEAKEELERLTKELKIRQELEERMKEEEKESVETKESVITSFEKEQEENAIISIDELMKKANDIYTQNEVVQYEDEGNEPISIDDLKRRWEEEQQMINEALKEEGNVSIEIEKPTPKTKEVEFISILPKKKEAFSSNFENSPIISPIYGIDRQKEVDDNLSDVELKLQNTANYEKFDEEIRKTNEFIAALKELQKTLD